MQWGSVNDRPEAMAPLMSETGFEAIIVAPAYRLNLLGFMASKELQDEAVKVGEVAGNLGFWDQRMALEWTAKNIGHFGGNASNITVGGKIWALFTNLSMVCVFQFTDLVLFPRVFSGLPQCISSIGSRAVLRSGTKSYHSSSDHVEQQPRCPASNV